jgi:hypothetical protein
MNTGFQDTGGCVRSILESIHIMRMVEEMQVLRM